MRMYFHRTSVRFRLFMDWIERRWPWLSVVGALAGLAGFLLVAYVVLELAPNWFAETKNLDAKGRADARQGVRTASLALLAGAIGVIGAIYTARTFALNRAGQLTDRFTKAIEQLGHTELDVRLGGIYALERIARDSKEDHLQVVEVLTAYVREHAPRRDIAGSSLGAHASQVERTSPQIHEAGTGAASPPPATDVQAVLTVLGRRTLAHEQDKPPRLNLSATNLSGADLGQAQLRRANLSRADLMGVDLGNANVIEADFTEAQLSGASLRSADLTLAVLKGADLGGANLNWANLTSVDITEANLSGAELVNANLSLTDLGGGRFSGAKLRWADLNGAILSGADFSGADLSNANLADAGVRGVNLSEADIHDATLSGADLSATDLSSANLAGADLSRARYDDETIWPTNFEPVAAGAIRIDDRDENPESRP
jgi:uncharacterized protein YjbI with pentapeptide repeats